MEWENVLLSRRDRAVRMLETLQRQSDAIGRPVEVIVLFNPDQVDRAVIEACLSGRAERGGSSGSVEWRLEPARANHYYALKNEGAARSRGQIVTFLDSDVIQT